MPGVITALLDKLFSLESGFHPLFLVTKSLFKVEMTLITLEILTHVVDATPLTLLGI